MMIIISTEATKARTPPSLLGIDRRIAYANYLIDENKHVYLFYTVSLLLLVVMMCQNFDIVAL